MDTSVLIDAGILAGSLVAIWIVSDKLVIAAHSISRIFGIPESIAGATIVAAATSFPEFMTSVFSIVLTVRDAGAGGGGYADVGIGTIVGSAVFNICIIIGVSSLFRPLKVSRRVVDRDCLWYALTTISTIAFVFDRRIEIAEAGVWLAMYFGYALVLYRDVRRYPEEAAEVEKVDVVPLDKAFAYLLLSVAGIGVACHFLVQATASLGGHLAVPSALLSLLALAAGTSVPDTLASIQAARKGLTSLAVSNAIGSSIFDVLLCLGLPMAIYTGVAGAPFDLAQLPPEMSHLGGVVHAMMTYGLVCLFASLVLSAFIVRTGWAVSRAEGVVLILLYALFAAGSVAIFVYRFEFEGLGGG